MFSLSLALLIYVSVILPLLNIFFGCSRHCGPDRYSHIYAKPALPPSSTVWTTSCSPPSHDTPQYGTLFVDVKIEAETSKGFKAGIWCPFAWCVCVCVFIKLHITTQSGPVILVILCHSVCVCVCVFIKLHITAQSGLVILVILCLCVCVFIKLHITAQSGLVILVILCHSHGSSQGGINDTCFLPIRSGHQWWTYQSGSHRREVTQDFSSTFFLRCVP